MLCANFGNTRKFKKDLPFSQKIHTSGLVLLNLVCFPNDYWKLDFVQTFAVYRVLIGLTLISCLSMWDHYKIDILVSEMSGRLFVESPKTFGTDIHVLQRINFSAHF